MKPKKPRKLINLLVGFGIAILLLWFFLKDADWTKVGEAIARANIWLIALSLTGHFAAMLIRAVRWRLLLSPLNSDIPLSSTWKYLNIGFAVTALLPGRIGEVLRPLLLAREHDIRFTSAFATVVTERIIDLLVILGMFATIFLFPGALGQHPDSPEVGMLKMVGLGAMLLGVVAVLFLIMVKVKTDWAVKAVQVLTKPLPDKISTAVVRLVQAFADGIGGLKSAGQVVGVVITSIASWLVITVSFWVALLAFGIDAQLQFCFFLLSIVALGVAIPTPGGAGPFHAAIILIVSTLWGFNYDTTVAFAIINHFLAFGLAVVFGIYYLSSGHINIFAAADKAGKME